MHKHCSLGKLVSAADLGADQHRVFESDKSQFAKSGHICFDGSTLHWSLPCQHSQLSEVAFLRRQGEADPTTVNTMVSATDRDQPSPQPKSHVLNATLPTI